MTRYCRTRLRMAELYLKAQAPLWRFGCDKLAVTTPKCRIREAGGSGSHTKSKTPWELHRPWNGCQEHKRKEGAKDYGKDANGKWN